MNTKARLVEATRASIREVGLPATTAREIVGRAGANLAAIPYHFGTKDALVTEALLAEARAVVEPVLAVLSGERPPLDRLTAAISLLNDLFDEHRQDVPTYLAAVAAAAHADEVRAGLEALWVEVRRLLAADIDALRDDGLLPDWVDGPVMAALILGVVNGVVVATVIDPGGPDHRAVSSQLAGLLTAVLGQ